MLSLHTGKSIRITLEELPVSAPVGTDTWQPLPHRLLVDLVKSEIKKSGLKIEEEEYAIKLGKKNRPEEERVKEGVLFGVLAVRNRFSHKEVRPIIAFRHGNDRDVALRMIAGFNVFVCDNMAFIGDATLISAKHLQSNNFRELVANAATLAYSQLKSIPEHIDKMKAERLNKQEYNATMFRAIKSGIMPLDLILKVDSEIGSFFGDIDWNIITVWYLHNAFTSVATKQEPSLMFELNQNISRFFGLN